MAKLIVWIIMIALVLGIIYYYSDPSSIKPIKKLISEKTENINIEKTSNIVISKQPLVTENKLISDCKKEINYYGDITKTKYGISSSISEVKEVSDYESVDDFSEIWRFGYNSDIELDSIQKQFPRYKRPELDFPIVVFAITFKKDTREFPAVIACNNEGELMEHSRNTFLNFNLVFLI